jgi:lysyl-tRNA synthetase class 2
MDRRSNVLKSRLIRRAQILRELRRILDDAGYIEVETPARVRSPGTDVNIEAFASEERYLITSPEFHMKRMLAQGFQRIYQICRCFRKGERTELHNPEFTMLEFYAAGLNLSGMMAEIEEIVWKLASAAGARELEFRGMRCDLQPPWERVSVEEAFRKYAGWSPLEVFDEERFYFDLVDKVDRHLGAGHPTILHHYPVELAMLAVRDPAKAEVALRFEVYFCGVEIANAFEELTQMEEQRRRFERDIETRRTRGLPLYPKDEIFLQSLSDLPPCSGIAVGLDRLIMLLTGAESIGEVLAFPDEEV